MGLIDTEQVVGQKHTFGNSIVDLIEIEVLNIGCKNAIEQLCRGALHGDSE